MAWFICAICVICGSFLALSGFEHSMSLCGDGMIWIPACAGMTASFYAFLALLQFACKQAPTVSVVYTFSCCFFRLAGLYGPLPVCKTSYSHRSTTARLYSALDSGHLHDPSHDVIRCTGATLLLGSVKPCLLAAHPVSVRPMVHRSLCNRKVATSYCLPNWTCFRLSARYLSSSRLRQNCPSLTGILVGQGFCRSVFTAPLNQCP